MTTATKPRTGPPDVEQLMPSRRELQEALQRNYEELKKNKEEGKQLRLLLRAVLRREEQQEAAAHADR